MTAPTTTVAEAASDKTSDLCEFCGKPAEEWESICNSCTEKYVAIRNSEIANLQAEISESIAKITATYLWTA